MQNKFNNLQEAFFKLSKSLDEAPEVFSRGSKQKERNFVSFCIEDPTQIFIDIPARKFSEDYAITEWLWYLSSDPRVSNIGKLATIWRQISDKNGQVESNYGFYLKPQWEWVKQEILGDVDTRRATIVINQPYHKNKNPKDYPCTQYIQFFVRENKLNMGVNMRSNDLVFGLCNDVFTFALFQQLMLIELRDAGLDIELGSYYHHAGSLHVYERHYDMVSEIINSGPYERPNKTFTLNSEITFASSFQLPSREMEKEEIKNYVQHAKRFLFDEYS